MQDLFAFFFIREIRVIRGRILLFFVAIAPDLFFGFEEALGVGLGVGGVGFH